MKNFYEHLSSRNEFGETIKDVKKPVLRSSGIFPVIQNSTYKTQILFMGYWLIKRNISEIKSKITLRDKSGKVIKTVFLSITEPRTYTIDLEYMFDNSKITDFLGSLEVEFFSTTDMIYPFSALVLNYYNNEFNTCVHTAGRIYNDLEDSAENEKILVPETGFDIYSTEDLSSFLAFVNGKKSNQNVSIDYIVTNFESKKLSGSFSIGKIDPFETVFLKFSEYISNLDEFLKSKSGSISLKHNLSGFFPRFFAGNLQKSFESVSLTHTYYDSTSCNSLFDYWDRINDNYNDSSVYIPIFATNDYFTELIIYPNLSPSKLDIQIDFHDYAGKILKSIPNYIQIDSSQLKLLKINFKQILDEYNLSPNIISSAHIITNCKDKKIPTRIKFGFNVGMNNKKSKIPCNICFNSKLGNPQIENKPGSFHWCPIFNDKKSLITIGNFSPKKNYSDSTNSILTFYHEKDSNFLKKEIVIPANTEYRFELDKNDDVKSFLGNNNGWLTIKSDNPFVHGYYFNFHSSGSVAGDHWF